MTGSSSSTATEYEIRVADHKTAMYQILSFKEMFATFMNACSCESLAEKVLLLSHVRLPSKYCAKISVTVEKVSKQQPMGQKSRLLLAPWSGSDCCSSAIATNFTQTQPIKATQKSKNMRERPSQRRCHLISIICQHQLFEYPIYSIVNAIS